MDAHRYTIFGILVASYLWWFMARENTKRAALREKGIGLEQEKVVVGSTRLGDRHPSYVYQL